MKTRVYLDQNATAPTRECVIDAVSRSLRLPGNPSSVHAAGREAHQALELARLQVAGLINARPRDIIFTSGGTEANNLAIRRTSARALFVSTIEHESIRAPSENWTGFRQDLDVDVDGRLDLPGLQAKLQAADGPALVSVMLANNETGVIQPLREITDIAHAAGALVHTDAVQALGKIPVDFQALGVDMMSISAHKIGGMAGTGALVTRPGLDIQALQIGGGQESGRRGGTENLAGIVGFGIAAEAAAGDLPQANAVRALRDRLEAQLTAGRDELLIHGGRALRLPNTTCLGNPCVKGETQVMAMDLDGFSVSSGSACSSGKVRPSHVLSAMGVDSRHAENAIRISLGYGTTVEDVDAFAAAWRRFYDRIADATEGSRA